MFYSSVYEYCYSAPMCVSVLSVDRVVWYFKWPVWFKMCFCYKCNSGLCCVQIDCQLVFFMQYSVRIPYENARVCVCGLCSHLVLCVVFLAAAIFNSLFTSECIIAAVCCKNVYVACCLCINVSVAWLSVVMSLIVWS